MIQPTINHYKPLYMLCLREMLIFSLRIKKTPVQKGQALKQTVFQSYIFGILPGV